MRVSQLSHQWTTDEAGEEVLLFESSPRTARILLLLLIKEHRAVPTHGKKGEKPYRYRKARLERGVGLFACIAIYSSREAAWGREGREGG